MLEALAEEGISVPARLLAVPDVLVEHGDPAEQLARFGLDADGIAAAAQRLLADIRHPGALPRARTGALSGVG